MAEAPIIDLDIRELSSHEHHITIFARFDTLNPGETLRLINNHHPRLLQYQFIIERPGLFEWEPEQQGPEIWVIRIRKTATET
ncbi:MAG: DUF2249 domain-containing protein [Ktedonobacteraceae bacterium]